MKTLLTEQSLQTMQSDAKPTEYVFNGTTWEEKPLEERKPSRPLNEKPEKPTVGDIFFDSSTGSQYVYYEDHEDHSWIQVGGKVSGA